MNTPSPAIIRPCQLHEIATVLALIERCGLTFAPCDREMHVRAKLAADPDSILVLDIDGRVMGCIAYTYDPMYTVVFHLAVDASVRGNGHARHLLETVHHHVQARGGTACVGAYIVEGNAASLALTRTLGYRTFPHPVTFVYRES